MKICELLDLSSKIVHSKDLSLKGGRSERLLKILEVLNCDTYHSPAGSRDYIEQDNVLPNSKINIVYQNFIPQSYRQHNSKIFYSHLSIIDVIANIGLDKTIEYIK